MSFLHCRPAREAFQRGLLGALSIAAAGFASLPLLAADPAPGKTAQASPAASQEAAPAQQLSASTEVEMPVKVILFPLREAVLASNIPAKVLEYKFKEGESFGANEVIVHLDDRSYQQSLLKGKALLAEAQATLKFTELNLKRNQDLLKKGTVGFQEVEQSQLERDTAESKQQFAAASLEQAKLDVDACFVKVPYNGRVTKKALKENEYVGIGQPLVEVIDDSKLLAVMHMPSDKRKSIKIGDELTIKVDETGTVHKGRIYEISGRINYESRTFELKALIDNPSRALTAGMSGVLVSGKETGSL